MRKLLIFHFTLGFFALFSCKDEYKLTVFLSQDIKDFCRFKDSSWWLYKNRFGLVCYFVKPLQNSSRFKLGHFVLYTLQIIFTDLIIVNNS